MEINMHNLRHLADVLAFVINTFANANAENNGSAVFTEATVAEAIRGLTRLNLLDADQASLIAKWLPANVDFLMK
jgi:hypothetical protein